ncbi:hypothetical protein B0T13DRAFT_473308 [Neurospora crassa]|nr:hypothetical protein B0T13DRAFT_473308 [Neurospora crassa]
MNICDSQEQLVFECLDNGHSRQEGINFIHLIRLHTGMDFHLRTQKLCEIMRYMATSVSSQPRGSWLYRTGDILGLFLKGLQLEIRSVVFCALVSICWDRDLGTYRLTRNWRICVLMAGEAFGGAVQKK